MGFIAAMGMVVAGLGLFLTSHSLPAVIIIIFGVFGIIDLVYYQEKTTHLDNLIEIINKRK